MGLGICCLNSFGFKVCMFSGLGFVVYGFGFGSQQAASVWGLGFRRLEHPRTTARIWTLNPTPSRPNLLVTIGSNFASHASGPLALPLPHSKGLEVENLG